MRRLLRSIASCSALFFISTSPRAKNSCGACCISSRYAASTDGALAKARHSESLSASSPKDSRLYVYTWSFWPGQKITA